MPVSDRAVCRRSRTTSSTPPCIKYMRLLARLGNTGTTVCHSRRDHRPADHDYRSRRHNGLGYRECCNADHAPSERGTRRGHDVDLYIPMSRQGRADRRHARHGVARPGGDPGQRSHHALCCAALRIASMSILCMPSIALIAACDLSGSGSLSRVGRTVGTTCQETPGST